MSQNPDELADSDQERLVRMPRNPELADMGHSDHEALQEDRQLEDEAEQGPSEVALPFGFQQNPQPSTSRQTGMAADGGCPNSGEESWEAGNAPSGSGISLVHPQQPVVSASSNSNSGSGNPFITSSTAASTSGPSGSHHSHQVWPLTQYFLFFVCKKITDMPGSMNSLWEYADPFPHLSNL